MNKREAFIRVLKREESDKHKRIFIPDIDLTPSKIEEFNNLNTNKTVDEYFGLFHRTIIIKMEKQYKSDGKYLFTRQKMPKEFIVDAFGTAESKGSEACHHMVHFHPTFTGECSIKDLENHPLPIITKEEKDRVKNSIKQIHGQNLAVRAWLEQTIWERSWLLRGMEDLMMDMMLDDPKAEIILNRITNHSCKTAAFLAEAGVDLIALGDDIGMQSTPLMAPELWLKYIQPKLARVISAAKKVNPNIIISYHSCGFIVPFIDGLIDAGVDVLNPLQPESVDIKAIYNKYKDKISFWGGIGTQTTFPFGTTEEVRTKVKEVAKFSEDTRGYLITPTHVIEPDVPWENLEAYRTVIQDLNK